MEIFLLIVRPEAFGYNNGCRLDFLLIRLAGSRTPCPVSSDGARPASPGTGISQIKQQSTRHFPVIARSDDIRVGAEIFLFWWQQLVAHGCCVHSSTT